MATGGQIPFSGRFALILAVAALQCEAFAGSQMEDLAAQAGYRILAPGDSSAAAQRRAAEGIPVNRMTGPARSRAVGVIRECNQYRHLPELQYSADPAMYRYLLQHPDVAVSTWRVMGISKFEMWQTGQEQYEARAVDGSEGETSVLYRDQQQCVFICSGSYHNPLLPRPLSATALVWLRSAFTPMSDGTWQVTQKADTFIVFESQGLSTFAKVLTPVTNTMMDRNLFEVSLYAGLMSRAVRDEPEWIIQVAQQLDGVLPQRSGELIAIARQRRPTSVTEAARFGTSSNRAGIVPSGITLSESQISEGLAAVPGASATPVPPVPLSTGTVTAARPSTALPFSQVMDSGRPALDVNSQNNVLVKEASASTQSSAAAAKNSVSFSGTGSQDSFVLQPVVVPPEASDSK